MYFVCLSCYKYFSFHFPSNTVWCDRCRWLRLNILQRASVHQSDKTPWRLLASGRPNYDPPETCQTPRQYSTDGFIGVIQLGSYHAERRVHYRIADAFFSVWDLRVERRHDKSPDNKSTRYIYFIYSSFNTLFLNKKNISFWIRFFLLFNSSNRSFVLM